jgi:hypothetical protein
MPRFIDPSDKRFSLVGSMRRQKYGAICGQRLDARR